MLNKRFFSYLVVVKESFIYDCDVSILIQISDFGGSEVKEAAENPVFYTWYLLKRLAEHIEPIEGWISKKKSLERLVLVGHTIVKKTMDKNLQCTLDFIHNQNWSGKKLSTFTILRN